MWVFYASRAVISVLKNGECQAVSPDSRRGETQFPNTNRGENWVWSPANLTEVIIKKQNRNSAFKDRIIWARTFLNLPQDVGGIASSFFVRQPVTKLSPRRANTVIAPSLLSPSLSLSPLSLSLCLFKQRHSRKSVHVFFPHLLISTVFSLFVPSFEFLIIAFFPREWLISVLCPSSLIIISTTSATGVIIVIIIHHVSIHHSHLPYVLEFPVHKNFSSTIALTTYAVSLL